MKEKRKIESEKNKVKEIIKEYVSDKNEYWILTTKLKGNNIVGIENCDGEWFYNMGKILARLHKAFDKCEDRINYWNNSLLGEMESWVSENISKEEIDYLKFRDM